MNRPDIALRSREGVRVDPWPFLVVSGLAVLLVFSFGPVYLISFGLPLSAALGISAAVFVGLVAMAYHRLVWTVTPDLLGETPAALRIQRIVYWTVALALVLFGLSLPFLSELV